MTFFFHSCGNTTGWYNSSCQEKKNQEVLVINIPYNDSSAVLSMLSINGFRSIMAYKLFPWSLQDAYKIMEFFQWRTTLPEHLAKCLLNTKFTFLLVELGYPLWDKVTRIEQLIARQFITSIKIIIMSKWMPNNIYFPILSIQSQDKVSKIDLVISKKVINILTFQEILPTSNWNECQGRGTNDHFLE